MRSCARFQGSQSSISKIKDDVKANDAMTVNDDTIGAYIKALEKIFVIEQDRHDKDEDTFILNGNDRIGRLCLPT